MARRYDSSTTTFSPEGRLHQVRLFRSFDAGTNKPWLVGFLGESTVRLADALT